MRTFLFFISCIFYLNSYSQPVFDWNYSVDCSTTEPTISVTVVISNAVWPISNLVCEGFDTITCFSNSVGQGGIVFGNGTANAVGESPFTVSFTGSDGMPYSETLTIPMIVPLSVTFSTNDYCGNSQDGSAAFSIDDPVAMEWSNIIWSDGTTDVMSLSGLSVGTYFYSIHDDICNVDVFDSFSIQQHEFLTTILEFDDYCGDVPIGLAEIFIVNQPNAQWSNVTWSTGDTDVLFVAPLSAGTYSYSINDDLCNVTITEQFTIDQLTPMSVSLNQLVNPCNGVLGSIDISASGGSGNYSYHWGGPLGYLSSAQNPTDINTGGNFTVYVTDNVVPSCAVDFEVVVLAGNINGDFNCDCVINTADLLLILGAYNTSNESPLFDMDNSGGVNTFDLLMFLAGYGVTC